MNTKVNRSDDHTPEQHFYGAFKQHDADILDNLTWEEKCCSCNIEKECDELNTCLITGKHFCETCWLAQPAIRKSHNNEVVRSTVVWTAITILLTAALQAVMPTLRVLAGALLIFASIISILRAKSFATSLAVSVTSAMSYDFWFIAPVREFNFDPESVAMMLILVAISAAANVLRWKCRRVYA